MWADTSLTLWAHGKTKEALVADVGFEPATSLKVGVWRLLYHGQDKGPSRRASE
jgi:hypothetical protein